MKPQLDESKARDYIGKTVLLGVSYLDHTGKQTSQATITTTSRLIGGRCGNISTGWKSKAWASIWRHSSVRLK